MDFVEILRVCNVFFIKPIGIIPLLTFFPFRKVNFSTIFFHKPVFGKIFLLSTSPETKAEFHRFEIMFFSSGFLSNF